MRIVHDESTTATADGVYALLADPTRRPAWLAELRRVDAPPGPAPAGAVFTGVSQAFLHRLEGQCHVLETEPGALVREHVVVGVGLHTTWEIESRPGGRTRIVANLDIDLPGGWFAPVERALLGWRLGRMQKRSLRTLARLAEREAPATS